MAYKPMLQVVHVAPAAETPCAECPWRTKNQGKRHPDGWYSRANLKRLWNKLRRGEMMSCHPTDPRNPVSDKALAGGSIKAKEGAQVRECAGALILQQRELMIYQEVAHQHENDPQQSMPAYRQARPRGLTKDGFQAMIERYLVGGSVMGGGKPVMHTPDLNNAEVSHPELPWEMRDPATRKKAG